MARDTDRPSYWITSTPGTAYPPFHGTANTDVVVVGGGIVGATTAYLLAEEDLDVVLLERGRIVHRDTGHTTAHATHVVDTPLPHLLDLHGAGTARAVWDANAFGRDLIERLVTKERIDCDFARVPEYVHASLPGDVGRIDDYETATRRIGYDAERVEDPGALPFPAFAALRFRDQARFHPRKYLLALASAFVERGGAVHEQSAVTAIEPDAGPNAHPVRVRTQDGHTLNARHVVVATNAPFNDRVRLWTRLYPYRSYVVGARCEGVDVPDALYSDTQSPLHYTRLQPDEDGPIVLFGGEDHKTGHAADAAERWNRLERTLREWTGGDVTVEWRWSAQDPRTQDHLAFIGVNPGSPPREWIATGFGGTGMTWGTTAAWMIKERILERGTPWDDVFDPQRFSLKEIGHYVRENADFPKRVLADRLPRRGARVDAADLAPGDGVILERDGTLLAVSRARDGELRAVKAACTHLGCSVAWNGAEESWDCPCHGSRFTAGGAVLEGPAKAPLERVDAPGVRAREAASR